MRFDEAVKVSNFAIWNQPNTDRRLLLQVHAQHNEHFVCSVYGVFRETGLELAHGEKYLPADTEVEPVQLLGNTVTPCLGS